VTPRAIRRLLCVIASVGLLILGLPGPAAAQGRSLTVSPDSGPVGSKVTLTGSDWSPEYYSSGVQISFQQNHGNGVLTNYADPILVQPDQQGHFSFEATIPTFFQPGDIVTFSGLIGNGSGERANFTVTSGETNGTAPVAVTVGKAYVANSAWAEATNFRPNDVVRYQIVITVSAPASINVKMQVSDPSGRLILDRGGDSQVSPSAGSVFFESSIPSDAPAGTYTQTATVTYNGATTIRTSSFSVAPIAFPGPPEWLTNLTEQDLFNCTVSMTALAAGIQSAGGAEMPVMIQAVEALSTAGDFEVFFKTLTSNSYWNGLLLASGNVFYEQFRTCFMGMQSAMQLTAGAAGRMRGEWLRGVIANKR
jgi:hypothetical protein